MTDDANDFATQAEHRPARIALVDRRVGLQEFRERHAAVYGVRLADVAHRERVADALGRPDDKDLIADFHRIGVTEDGDLHSGRQRLELEESEVGLGL